MGLFFALDEPVEALAHPDSAMDAAPRPAALRKLRREIEVIILLLSAKNKRSSPKFYTIAEQMKVYQRIRDASVIQVSPNSFWDCLVVIGSQIKKVVIHLLEVSPLGK